MIKLKEYEIIVKCDSLKNCGLWVKTCLPLVGRVFIISNKKVFGLFGETVTGSLSANNLLFETHLIGDGEKFKNFKTLEKTLSKMSEARLTRTDVVIALGGGVVGDLSGFAASIYLRGIPFLQIPTTLLSMIDSSVGGKTAVNTDFGKNLIGTFYQPSGVLVDVKTLQTLAKRELAAGFCEAFKQSIISGISLFDETSDFLNKYTLNNLKSNFSEFTLLEELITNQIIFKAKIVSGDEREDISRNDSSSRKILNFGHTIAHALEKVTNYRRFKHGEAVGLGILVACEISNNLDFLQTKELNLINDVLRRLGSFPKTKDLNIDEIIKAITFDKKSVGNSVKWILLEKIGSPIIVDGSEIPEIVVKKSILKVFSSLA